jgi:hypothetical protein
VRSLAVQHAGEVTLHRGLDRSLTQDSAWVREHQNIFPLGPTGVGKSWLACALAEKACRDGFTAIFIRAPQLFRDLALARADGILSVRAPVGGLLGAAEFRATRDTARAKRARLLVSPVVEAPARLLAESEHGLTAGAGSLRAQSAGAHSPAGCSGQVFS